MKVKSGQFETPRADVWEDVLFVDYADVDASAGVCDELVDEDITFQVSAERGAGQSNSAAVRSEVGFRLMLPVPPSVFEGERDAFCYIHSLEQKRC